MQKTKFSKVPVYIQNNIQVNIFSNIADGLMWDIRCIIKNNVKNTINDYVVGYKKLIKDEMSVLGILHAKKID